MSTVPPLVQTDAPRTPGPGYRPLMDDPPAIATPKAPGVDTLDGIKETARRIRAHAPRKRLGILQACQRRLQVLRQTGVITPAERADANRIILPAIAEARRWKASK